MSDLCLLAEDGTEVALDVERWRRPPDADELAVLDRVRPPVIDLGCGPGRHVLALAERGYPALGIDAAPSAVAMARARGALVLERSVFTRLPGAGRWGTALLLDGNIGIGGDPVGLLGQARALVRSDGIVLAEVEGPGTPTATKLVRLAEGADVGGPAFPWTIVGVDDLARLAASAGLVVDDVWERGGRWFSLLAPD
jgi:SAM-dependent methyltransferase